MNAKLPKKPLHHDCAHVVFITHGLAPEACELQLLYGKHKKVNHHSRDFSCIPAGQALSNSNSFSNGLCPREISL